MPQDNTGSPYSKELHDAQKKFTFHGFEIHDKKEGPENEKVKSFVPPLEENETSIIASAGSVYGHSIDVRGDQFTNDRDMIIRYRNSAMHPEADKAIKEIVNEMVVANDEDLPISLNLEHVALDESVKKKIVAEFDHIVDLLDFRKYAHDIIRRWYIDGRIAYHNVIDLNNPDKGIIELRPISPLRIQKVKEVIEEQDERTGSKMITGWDEYFIYSEDGFASSQSSAGLGSGQGGMVGLKVAKDSVAYVTSGLTDPTRRFTISHLHKSMRAINQLRMMEDSAVIYRMARAPERRLFYIDVSDMGKPQAASYMNSIMQKYRNKMSYDPTTGEVNSDRNHMHMLEDFWLPRGSGGKGTEVSSLPGGDQLGRIEDIIFFKQQLLESMDVPYGRMASGADVGSQPFVLGRTSEIDRDEVRFQKFIDSMRIKFADLFRQTLKVQLVLKNVLASYEWDQIKNKIIFDYARDNYFSELKEAEILRERIAVLNEVEPFVGQYFSKEYVRKDILRMTDEQIKKIKAEIRAEALNNDGLPNPEDDVDLEGGGGAPGGGASFEGDLGGPEFGPEGGEGVDAEIPLGEPEGASTALGADGDELGPEDEGDDLPDDEEEI